MNVVFCGEEIFIFFFLYYKSHPVGCKIVYLSLTYKQARVHGAAKVR